MRAFIAMGTLAVVLAGCGGRDEPEEREEPMKVEDTVFAPLVTAPDRAGQRANDAVELHRDNMNQRLEQDEGGTGEDPPAGD